MDISCRKIQKYRSNRRLRNYVRTSNNRRTIHRCPTLPRHLPRSPLSSPPHPLFASPVSSPSFLPPPPLTLLSRPQNKQKTAIHSVDPSMVCLIGPAKYYNFCNMNATILINSTQVVYTYDFFVPEYGTIPFIRQKTLAKKRKKRSKRFIIIRSKR